MKLHVLERNLDIPVTLKEAWDFFSNPLNLALITPPWLGFRLKSEAPERIYPGLLLTCTVSPFFGLPVDWVTEITQAREPDFFADDQRTGPYRLWHHEHAFKEIRGGVRVHDLVHYALPFGPLGNIAHELVVKKQLREIFDYRSAYLANKFGRIS
jgi:ligand-binding SRPBCC domain-containing protein